MAFREFHLAAKIFPAIGPYPCVNHAEMKYYILTTVATLTLTGLCLAADPAIDKDNTGINKRDSSGETLTPEDQSNTPEDVKITQAIRQAVVKDDSLSMAAKNIKIITINGAVTLRGPVKSAEEKASIVKKAATVIAADKVTDELEVESK